MKYREGEQQICLRVDASLSKSEVSLSTMFKTVRKGGQGFFIELGRVEMNSTGSKQNTTPVSPNIQRILDGYTTVYEPLQGLPPRRTRDHAIVIKEGAAPPNVRPYRAVLMQEKRPIAYFSQLLSNRARKCSVYERELMAIVFAVKKWRHYLLGHKFIIWTDQKALKYLLAQRIIDPDQQKWASKLMGYNFEIHYKPGVKNKAADALSRKGEDMELKAFLVWRFDEWEKEVKEDAQLNAIKQQVISGQKPPAGYSLHNGFLVYQGRLAIPKGLRRAVKLIEDWYMSYHFWYQSSSFRGMVNTRMEGRVESTERDMGAMKGELTAVKGDMDAIKEWLLEIKDSMARLEKKVDGKDDQMVITEGSGKLQKLELPIFDGEEAVGWLFKVERYFNINRMREEEKLEVVTVCMDGKALNWLQCGSRRG
ncbi:putative mitochondrial protein [Senna tora]|uniref:Putative mitochondrial protein n=1 Tax=Senna tora TaxID=362788 RepID=A0A834X7I4_9FABA|nr:putative mitochondrial protein [Senna tora]